LAFVLARTFDLVESVLTDLAQLGGKHRFTPDSLLVESAASNTHTMFQTMVPLTVRVPSYYSPVRFRGLHVLLGDLEHENRFIYFRYYGHAISECGREAGR
jgi:hypothetical protein